MGDIKIICGPDKSNPFIVIYKPRGIPSAPLALPREDGVSALEKASLVFPEIKGVRGKLPREYGLLHRIDTAAAGLLLIAATQESYGRLFDSQLGGKFEKSYRARCCVIEANAKTLGGFPPPPPFSRLRPFDIVSSFRAYGAGGKEVRPVWRQSGKAAKKKSGGTAYVTRVELSPPGGAEDGAGCHGAAAICTITRGFRHQVRCHLAWAGFPVQGDTVYNSACRRASEKTAPAEMEFEAFRLSFPHPVSGDVVTVKI